MTKTRLIKSCVTFILICGMGSIVMTPIASADVDDRARWPVESTSNWNSVYGKVLDLPLGNGDSVGMFDSKGNCYGAGLIREGYYYLSAFSREEADPTIPGDFTIPGFEEGDEVIFKGFERSTAEKYVLTPAGGNPYIYTHEGKYPPLRIDLVYADPSSYSSSTDNEDLPSDDEETNFASAGERGYAWGGAPYVYLDEDIIEPLAEKEKDETDPGELNEKYVPLIEPEIEVIEKIAQKEAKGDIGRRNDDKKQFDTDYYKGYDTSDYYERRSSSAGEESPKRAEPSEYNVEKSSEYAVRADRAASSGYASEEKQGDKETIVAEESEAAEARSPETARALDELEDKRSPLIHIAILICVIPVSIMGLLKLRRD